ncbi:MAG: AAA family ATPase [Acidobacteriota bacterium]
MGQLIQDLLAPNDQVIETHISWVLLRGDDVFKIKKPVALGFLDFSGLEQRRAACEAERELNARLAPGVYLSCVPVTRDLQGRHRFGGEGEPVEWAVHMKRLPLADRADVRLAHGRLDARCLEQVAERLAEFHASARCDETTTAFGSVATIATNVRENFEQTRDRLERFISAQQAEEMEVWQTAFLDTHGERFEARQHAGRVRDGHGDLRLEHVYFGPGDEVLVLDCIEFNDRFRFADVCADIAFLAMDLAWHDRPELAERFLASYAQQTNDYELYRLVDFYESYRAFVRGKIASISAVDPQSPHDVRQRATEEARKYFLLAQASERRALVPPRVVAVGGIIASGKSTVAGALGARLAVPVLEADRTRKALLGVASTDPLHVPAWSGPYAPGQTERTYDELWRRADAVLASGRSVIIDASFRSRAKRLAARELARRHDVPFLFVECQVDQAVCRWRLHQRARSASTSDGRLEIFDDFVASWERVDELAESEHQVLETTQPIASNLQVLLDRLGIETPSRVPAYL